MRKLYHRDKCLSRFFTKIICGRQVAARTVYTQALCEIVGADTIRPLAAAGGVPPLCKGRWIFAAGEKTEGLYLRPATPHPSRLRRASFSLAVKRPPLCLLRRHFPRLTGELPRGEGFSLSNLKQISPVRIIKLDTSRILVNQYITDFTVIESTVPRQLI